MPERVPGGAGGGVLPELLAVLRPERRRAAAAIGLGSAASLAAVALATSSAWLIDRAAERPGLTALTAAMCLVQFLAFSKAGLRYFERLQAHDLAFRLLGRLRVRFFATLARLTPAGLGSARTGDVLSRSIDDVDRLQSFYLLVVPLSVTGAVTIVAAVCVAALLVPLSALALAGGLLLNAFALPLLAHRLAKKPARRVAEAGGEIAGDVADLLAAAPELAASGRLSPWLERLAARDADMRAAQMQAARRRGACQALSVLVAGGTVIVLLLLTMASLRNGSLPRVDAAVLPVLALTAFESVANLPEAFSMLPQELEAGARLLGLERLPTPVREPAHAVALAEGGAALAFEAASVRYDGAERPALSGFSHRVGAGRRLGIAGASGSGKSTVASALLRLVELESGRVRLGDTDVATAAAADVRRRVGTLSGVDHVFAGSIEANLAMARPTATAAELWAALQTVGLAEMVERLPGRLAAGAGENGALLSGGERQRLCLARLLLRESAVVVLDEPTAHLDEATGARVLDDTLLALGDRTIVLMSHRRDDLARMDETITLEGGRLVDRPSPATATVAASEPALAVPS
ncbi:MAG: thiol reductant ABC exporter subunit CydC [Acidimicrobiales bacterium]